MLISSTIVIRTLRREVAGNDIRCSSQYTVSSYASELWSNRSQLSGSTPIKLILLMNPLFQHAPVLLL